MIKWSGVLLVEHWRCGGFSEGVRRLIMNYVTTVQYSILINGGIFGSVSPSWGLRQGDPLSLYFFIMCLEFLTRLICSEEAKGGLHGIKVSRIALALTHLMYANDLLVMCRANKDEAAAIKKCFNKYCAWSGQEISSEKSSILFSKYTRNKDQLAIREHLNFKEMARDSIYLGSVLMFSRNKAKEFKILKDWVSSRFEGWSRHLLSKAGKATLIKSVVQAIPTYSMSTFRVPIGVCNDMDSMMRKFWGGAKPNAKGFFSFESMEGHLQAKEVGRFGVP